MNVPTGLQTTRSPNIESNRSPRLQTSRSPRRLFSDTAPHRYSPEEQSHISEELDTELENLLTSKHDTPVLSALHARPYTTFKKFSPLRSLRVSQFSTPAATERSCFTIGPSSELMATLTKRGFTVEDNRPMIRRT